MNPPGTQSGDVQDCLHITSIVGTKLFKPPGTMKWFLRNAETVNDSLRALAGTIRRQKAVAGK